MPQPFPGQILLAERAVPRYTSYPTAPHFSAAVTGADYEAWLAALAPDDTLSIYLHVPFCRALCHYCGCHTKAVLRPEPVAQYAELLAREIGWLAGHAGSRRVTRIHWGGGTPAMLGEETLRRLAAALDAAFDLSDLVEHAIELDPRYVTPWLARTLAEIGVTRASLGVQDLAPEVQVAIGRVQPFELVRHAADCLREAGVLALNADLMYGLPRQTVAEVRRSAEAVAGLGVDRIALFGYAHVPWFKTHQRLIDEATLPGAAERLTQAETAREVLTGHGFAEIGIDHFARPHDELAIAARAGRLHRNFQGYVADDSTAIIGFGASAIGRLPQGFVQNAGDVGGYGRAVAAGRPATARGLVLTAEDRLRAAVIERLMCDLAVDLSAFAPLADAAGLPSDLATLADPDLIAMLAGAGFIETTATQLYVTPAGRPFVRLAASAFDCYLRHGGARHSRAV